MYNLMSTATCFSNRAGFATGISSLVSHNIQYNSLDNLGQASSERLAYWLLVYNHTPGARRLVKSPAAVHPLPKMA